MNGSLRQTRGKPVSFRMTDAEYLQARSASLARGARCFSDFARGALLQAMQDSETANCPLCPGGSMFVERLTALEVALRRLTESLEGGSRTGSRAFPSSD